METITISLSGLTSKIKRHLSVIGKRMYDKEGKNLFSNITTSTAEDTIFEHYTDLAAQNIAAALANFVTEYTNSSIVVQSERWSAQVKVALKNAAESYALLFTIGEYLAMTHPDLAKKYQEDAVGTMATIVTTASNKVTPTQVSVSYNDINGTAIKMESTLPEFDGNTSGFYYLKGRVSDGIASIENPVVLVNVEDLKIIPVDGEEILFGCLFSFKEDKTMVIAEKKETNTLLAAIRTRVSNAMRNIYELTFTTPSETDSYGYIVDPPIGFIRLS